MLKIPYVAPRIYNYPTFSARLPASQAPGYATNCTYLAGAAPASESEITLLTAWPVRQVTDEVAQPLATHQLNC